MLLFSHPSSLRHDTGPGHPERIARMEALMPAIEGANLPNLVRREAPEATLEQIRRVHPEPYPGEILASEPAQGHVRLDPDTVMSPGSGEAALRAAGAVCAAVDAVLAGEDERAFCAVRPCGHHAEPQRAMGFCLFNNVAVGAMQARHAHKVGRIAIVDFDVHHGNGTQASFWNDRETLFVSTHQWPLFPGTGAAQERGIGGNIVNCPLSPGAGSAEFRAVVESDVLPAVDKFAPELLFISAGFDAHRADPLANLQLVEDDFAWITEELVQLARAHCRGRIVSTLEGGYDLGALARSAVAHLRALGS
jgi:acetoin utilization deacetylase AcuC-like enzyme